MSLHSSPLSYFSGYFIDYESKLFGKNGASSLEQVAVSASLNNYIFINKVLYIYFTWILVIGNEMKLVGQILCILLQ